MAAIGRGHIGSRLAQDSTSELPASTTTSTTATTATTTSTTTTTTTTSASSSSSNIYGAWRRTYSGAYCAIYLRAWRANSISFSSSSATTNASTLLGPKTKCSRAYRAEQPIRAR